MRDAYHSTRPINYLSKKSEQGLNLLRFYNKQTTDYFVFFKAASLKSRGCFGSNFRR
jgi:hypothetical protein